MAKKLATYAKRRNVKRSKEPQAKVASSREGTAFVVQQHAARAMHYDLRLEVGGVMKSWAIPKGPSLNPSQRRLAVLTDDHPLSYKNFEGVIPEGEYGAGRVIVWDRGKYKNIKTSKAGKPMTMAGAFRKGTIEIFLRGKKLRGAFALVRMQGKNWLLIKMKDEHANLKKNITMSEPYSVKSGRKINDL
ncbi:MAG: DNA ligase [Chlamydiales bacterium]|nr:DNA ligase [Chlamydiales bacterium]